MSDGEIIEDLLSVETGLTDWEVGFVESIAESFDQYKSLTDLQRKKAEEILERLGL